MLLTISPFHPPTWESWKRQVIKTTTPLIAFLTFVVYRTTGCRLAISTTEPSTWTTCTSLDSQACTICCMLVWHPWSTWKRGTLPWLVNQVHNVARSALSNHTKMSNVCCYWLPTVLNKKEAILVHQFFCGPVNFNFFHVKKVNFNSSLFLFPFSLSLLFYYLVDLF